jgi:hypothetical protein
MGVLGRFPDVTLFTDSDFTSEVPR